MPHTPATAPDRRPSVARARWGVGEPVRLSRSRLLLVFLSCCSLLPIPAVATELFGPAAPSFPVGLSPSDLATGDFNADGATDLAVANSGSDTVSLLLGDGLGGILSTMHVDRP